MGNITLQVFAAAFQQLKSRKDLGPGSTSPEFLIHAEAGLKYWLKLHIFFLLDTPPQNTEGLKSALGVTIPKPLKPIKDPNCNCLMFLSVFPTKLSSDLFIPTSNLIDHLLKQEQTGVLLMWKTNQVTLLTQSIEDAFDVKKKKAGAVLVNLTGCLRCYMALWPH